MFKLSTLGFGPFFENQVTSIDVSDCSFARISAEHRGAYEVWSHAGVQRAQLAGRLRRQLQHTDMTGVGDWVLVRLPSPSADSPVIIERVLSRRTLFSRGAAGRETRAQVVAANVDLVFCVCGLDADFNLHRIERYLARIWASGAQPAVILNKADLCDDVAGHIQEVQAHACGVAVHAVSALHDDGIEALRSCIHEGMTVALVGSSGAGKSTLVNALVGEDMMPTAAVRASDDRGCHTTTHRQLLLLPSGGLLLDTPGMRELSLVDDTGLDTVFGDVAAVAVRCRYRDCRHESEPGCAIRAAVESGELDADRFEHYQKLEQEAAAYEVRNDARKRRQAARLWGQLSDEVAMLRRWKGGKG